jgi:hypothetical protein
VAPYANDLERLSNLPTTGEIDATSATDHGTHDMQGWGKTSAKSDGTFPSDGSHLVSPATGVEAQSTFATGTPLRAPSSGEAGLWLAAEQGCGRRPNSHLDWYLSKAFLGPFASAPRLQVALPPVLTRLRAQSKESERAQPCARCERSLRGRRTKLVW